jgi:glycosyltransferase involved in cell wall biosynthesis
MKKVSLICTTYRRFECIKRIIAQFEAQTYPNKELILFNTDTEYPYELWFEDDRIKVINNGINYITKKPYTNRGDICRDAVEWASGDYFMLMDDDDIYLPWYVEQAVNKIEEVERDAWKPERSFFATQHKLELVKNTMEASCIVKMDRIKEIGFRSDLTGYEGLSWYTKLRDEGNLNENYNKFLPAYCFNWGDPSEMAGHKQSGDIDNPNNFYNHKEASGDHAREGLVPISVSDLNDVYKKYFEFLKTHKNEFDKESFDKWHHLFLD